VSRISLVVSGVYVTSSNAEDGFAQAIERYILAL
jgi:hydroxymethylpyrimidine pyrophosphatase-like HAD family hydrolase